MSTISLTGGQEAVGHATKNTKTDSYVVSGANNTITTLGGGNLNVTGKVTDTNTTVQIGGVDSPTANQFQDKITVTLDGSHNKISSLGPLNDAMIDITVSGGGSNSINLNNNGDGNTTIDLSGTKDSVILNGDAENSVSLSGGMALIEIGSANDESLGFTSAITLSGNDNKVTGGDENISVTGGVSQNHIVLGNGNDTVNLSGIDNFVSVGNGRNSIGLIGSANTIEVGDGSNVISATGGNESIFVNSGGSNSGSDSILLGGSDDKVTEIYSGVGSPANISIFGSSGNASIYLNNGNDNVNTVGNGNVIVVGSGSDTISNSGSDSNITLNGNGLSVDSTIIGDDDKVVANNGIQQVSVMSGDTISLSDTRLGSAITFGGSSSSALLLNDGSAKTTFNVNGTGNSLTVDADSSGHYTGNLVVDDLIPGHGTLSFNGLAGLATSQEDLNAFLGGAISGGYEITTPGGGTVTIHTHSLSLSMFG